MLKSAPDTEELSPENTGQTPSGLRPGNRLLAVDENHVAHSRWLLRGWRKGSVRHGGLY